MFARHIANSITYNLRTDLKSKTDGFEKQVGLENKAPGCSRSFAILSLQGLNCILQNGDPKLILPHLYTRSYAMRVSIVSSNSVRIFIPGFVSFCLSPSFPPASMLEAICEREAISLDRS